MIFYKRERVNNGEARKRHAYVQASINSYGELTLREFDHDSCEEELIVFDQEEATAIFELLRQITDLYTSVHHCEGASET